MKKVFVILSLLFLLPPMLMAQEVFSLEDCISYALEHSTDISRAQNNVSTQSASLEQSKAARLPNLQLGVNQQLSSKSTYNTTESQWDQNGNLSLNATLYSQVMLYNGAKLKNSIRQNEIDLESTELNIRTEQELLSLNILSYYINVLLAKDNLTNSVLQLEATQEQLTYTEARYEAGAIPATDLLNMKSQLASNKTETIEAQSSLRIALVSLMQAMNMPLDDDFDIEQPDLDNILNTTTETDPEIVFAHALGIQPNIKSALLNIESAQTGVDIAKSGFLPSLSLNGSIGSGYASNNNYIDFENSYANNINSYIGLNLSVPIFQRKQVKTQVTIAEIQTNNYELELMDLKNSLRKYIEQACTDAQTAQSSYGALQEQLTAEQESYKMADEMFSQGMINAVDMLMAKNNLTIAENKFTQSKYNLILQNRILDYYLGNAISL